MKDLKELIKHRLQESAYVKMLLFHRAVEPITRITRKIIDTLRAGKSVYLFGNGGSAADAQHIAAELQGMFYKSNRKPLPVVSLTTNTSILTAIGNDFGYEYTFERQVQANVKRGDAVIAISTSGNSLNVLRAVRAAKKLGAYVIGFTGRNGGKLKRDASLALSAPSDDVARIQECHITAGHIICEMVEATLGKK